MDILIPMAWRWKRFLSAWYTKPKPFLDVWWKTMIERAIESINIFWRVILIINAHDFKISQEICNTISYLKERYQWLITINSDKKLEWPAKTALEARELLSLEKELIIAYCDQIMDWNSWDFLDKARFGNKDGIVTTYSNQEDKNGFVICNWDNVEQLVHKKVVSHLATIWLYYWKRSDIFLEGADKMISRWITYNGEFYIWPIFNQNIEDGYKIWYYHTWVHQVWNPKDYEQYVSVLKDKNI